MSDIKLFCFPYAGGSAVVFSRWQSFFKNYPGIEVVPVELTGRGKRIVEPLYETLDEAVDDLYNQIRTDKPYAFFGHSLGAFLAYELAQKIKGMEVRQPLHLFFSGRGAPNLEYVRRNYHLMTDQEFREEVIRLGGTPAEFFDYPELMELFLPLLRSDFKLAESNLHNREIHPFSCNMTIITGKQDYKVTQEQLDNWALHTEGECTVHYMEGGHFFLHDEIPQIAAIINNAMSSQQIFKI